MVSVFRGSSKKRNSKHHENTKNAAKRGDIDSDRATHAIIDSSLGAALFMPTLDMSMQQDGLRFRRVKLSVQKITTTSSPCRPDKKEWGFRRDSGQTSVLVDRRLFALLPDRVRLERTARGPLRQRSAQPDAAQDQGAYEQAWGLVRRVPGGEMPGAAAVPGMKPGFTRGFAGGPISCSAPQAMPAWSLISMMRPMPITSHACLVID